MQMTMQMSTSGGSGRECRRKPAEYIRSWLEKKRKQEKKNPSILNSKVTMVAREFMTNKNFTRRLYILYNRIYNIYYIMQII